MADLARVRAEIKAWERAFAARHGRDPAIQDIRDAPDIAEKYKRYKTLSRAPRLPAPKAPPADAHPPPGFNPFSPTKKPPGARRTHTPPSLPAPPTAVSRARKRLRGEPVSPSPSKPKRQRTRPDPEQDSSPSDHGSDQELPFSFVADSPVKAPAGGKSFKLLFDDAPVSKKLFPATQPHSVPPHRAFADPTPNNPISADKPPHKPAFLASDASQPSSSVKRALDNADFQPTVPLPSQHSLVPPSPPQDPIIPPKAKAKATLGRKRLRVEEQVSEEEADPPGPTTLKISTVRYNRPNNPRPNDLDWHPPLHLGTPNHDPPQTHHVSGTFTVDLPDKFRNVLAISPSRSHRAIEERVVRGLLYGHRVAHYDPSRGGDVWDAGETDEGVLGDVDTEEDWEGEPVPWEVGEL